MAHGTYVNDKWRKAQLFPSCSCIKSLAIMFCIIADYSKIMNRQYLYIQANLYSSAHINMQIFSLLPSPSPNCLAASMFIQAPNHPTDSLHFTLHNHQLLQAQLKQTSTFQHSKCNKVSFHNAILQSEVHELQPRSDICQLSFPINGDERHHYDVLLQLI
jgi:hypothetical protein